MIKLLKGLNKKIKGKGHRLGIWGDFNGKYRKRISKRK